MSFKKRGEPLNPRGDVGRTIPGVQRIQRGIPGNSQMNQRRDLSRAGGISDAKSIGTDEKHSAVRPSILTSQPTISTGSSHLDEVLGHLGLPLSSMLLVEESGSTDFANSLLKCFVSQGVVQSRNTQSKTRSIVIGVDNSWAQELPGLYKGKKEAKSEAIQKNESQTTVQNVLNSSNLPKKSDSTVEKKVETDSMKIAWRYGLKKVPQATTEKEETGHYPHYTNNFDVTTRLLPQASPEEVFILPPLFNPMNTLKSLNDSPQAKDTFYDETIRKIWKICSGEPNTIFRIVLPHILNPTFQTSATTRTEIIIPFIHSLRAIVKHLPNTAVVASLNTELYPRTTGLNESIEGLFDGVIELEPFSEQFLQTMEKIDPKNIKQGFLHLIKIPELSDRGQMTTRFSEYAFRIGKSKFEIEEWSIPVDETEAEAEETNKNLSY